MNNRFVNFISISGSVSSIIALIIVLIGNNSENPQLTVWRTILALISILFIGGIIVFYFDLIKEILTSASYSFRKKVVRTTLHTTTALIFLAVALDAVFAAIMWRVWLGYFLNFLYRFIS